MGLAIVQHLVGAMASSLGAMEGGAAGKMDLEAIHMTLQTGLRCQGAPSTGQEVVRQGAEARLSCLELGGGAAALAQAMGCRTARAQATWHLR